MACYNCEHLVVSNKKDGSTNGCLYYCSKNKTYVNGASDGCDNYNKDISRPAYINNDIYNNGRHYYNGSNLPLSVQVLLIVVLIILAIIANL